MRLVRSSDALAKQISCVVNEFADWIDCREKNISVIEQKAIWEDNMKAVEEAVSRLVC